MEFLFKYFKIRKPSYLDIGGYDPFKYNNTYYFYKKGAVGVNVEPSPENCKKFASKRKKDTNLNVGVAGKEGTLDFYNLPGGTLSTFSKETADRYVGYGSGSSYDTLKIDVVTVNSILDKYFEETPNFVSIDVEGFEIDILNSFDFEKYRPEVFCIETAVFNEARKEEEIFNIMKKNGYIVYADTYINTIFTDEKRFKAASESLINRK